MVDGCEVGREHRTERVVVGRLLDGSGRECDPEEASVRRAFTGEVALVELSLRFGERVLVEVDHVHEATGRVNLLELEELALVAGAVVGAEDAPAQREPFAAHRDGSERDVREARREDGPHRVEVLVAAGRSGRRHHAATVDTDEVVGDQLAGAVEVPHVRQVDESGHRSRDCVLHPGVAVVRSLGGAELVEAGERGGEVLRIEGLQAQAAVRVHRADGVRGPSDDGAVRCRADGIRREQGCAATVVDLAHDHHEIGHERDVLLHRRDPTLAIDGGPPELPVIDLYEVPGSPGRGRRTSRDGSPCW